MGHNYCKGFQGGSIPYGGDVVEGGSLEAKGQEIFEEVLRVASGKKTKSELLGYGDNEFVPWQVGATM